MRIPVIHGVIERRILANYRVDPEVLARVLPAPFRPKLINGVGIAGVCLIRLKGIKPRFISGDFGLSSENAAHRIAVEWIENGTLHEGVYVPRRDTSSTLKALIGGRLFPGVQHRARFNVLEGGGHYHVALDSKDRETHVLVEGQIGTELPEMSAFGSLSEASAFFEAGSFGYSATSRPSEYDALELRSFNWSVEPLDVETFESSFFENKHLFPQGSLQFDCALIMRNIQHEWHGQESMRCS